MPTTATSALLRLNNMNRVVRNRPVLMDFIQEAKNILQTI